MERTATATAAISEKSAAGISRQAGVGLIEVLVTVLLLSTSLLALAALQNRALQYNHEAYLRSQANILAYDISERIRINRDSFTSYQTDFDDSAPSGSSTSATDLREWHQRLRSTLPDAQGAIDCDATTRVCTISIRWVESDVADTGDDGANTRTTFTYQTRM